MTVSVLIRIVQVGKVYDPKSQDYQRTSKNSCHEPNRNGREHDAPLPELTGLGNQTKRKTQIDDGTGHKEYQTHGSLFRCLDDRTQRSPNRR
ncbi:MAG: hypothetical protein J0M26_00925 [Planctomycetes bacterium]|nr:hypothetical protein [Planctomycetota bacterium]